MEAAEPGAPIAVAAGEKPLVVRAAEAALVAVVPTWRRDLHIEADVAEEVARVGGYDAVPTKTPDTQMPHYRTDPPASAATRCAARSSVPGSPRS